MTIHKLAPMYWRSLIREVRTFAKVPPEVQESVKELARQDVQAGRITPEQYETLIGEAYINKNGDTPF